MKRFRLLGVAASGALLLAACSSTSASSTTTTTSTTSTTSAATSSTSGAGIAAVWPPVRTAYGAVSADLLGVGKDVAAFASTNGAGPTTALLADLRDLSGALATAQEVAAHAVATVSSSDVGYGQLSAFSNAIASAQSSVEIAQSACAVKADTACLARITALNTQLTAANRAGARLNGVAANG